MNDKQHSKIKRFLESVKSDNPLAIVVQVYTVDNKLLVEAQGGDQAVGEIYMANYKNVKEAMDQGLIKESEL